MHPPTHKRKLDKTLWSRGDQPTTDEGAGFPDADRGPSNDTIKRGKHTLPIPTDPYEIEREALYKAKLKKREDQEKRAEQERVALEWNVDGHAYDPQGTSQSLVR